MFRMVKEGALSQGKERIIDACSQNVLAGSSELESGVYSPIGGFVGIVIEVIFGYIDDKVND